MNYIITGDVLYDMQGERETPMRAYFVARTCDDTKYLMENTEAFVRNNIRDDRYMFVLFEDGTWKRYTRTVEQRVRIREQ